MSELQSANDHLPDVPDDFSFDAGTGWARALTPSQVAELVDIAGELSQVFPVRRRKRVAREAFERKLEELGAKNPLDLKLTRVVGFTSGRVTLWSVWWSWCWVVNYARVIIDQEERDEEKAIEDVASRMKIAVETVHGQLARRDISYLINIFFSRHARELEGEIRFKTALDALDGKVRAQELYFRHISKEEEAAPLAGEIDPWGRSEEELRSMIKRLKKEVGTIAEQDTIPIDVEVKDVDA